MPHYSGVANSFADLRTALFNACVAEGWTLTGEILTKGTAAVKVEVNTVPVSTKGIGLLLQAGTSVSGGALVQPSGVTPRFGPPQANLTQPSWPMTYEISIFDSPDEVYMVARFNVDFHYWLAFGLSDIPGLAATGVYVSAISSPANPNFGGLSGGITINTTGGGSSEAATGAFGWSTDIGGSAYTNQDTIATGLDSVVWANSVSAGTAGQNSANAILCCSQQISVLPNAWNSETVLIPIKMYQWRPSNKCSLVLALRNARYVRVDNYEPGQVITLGSDRWKVFPFYRKNTTARNGGGNIEHTGTFGWAIRYDGP